MKFWIALFLGLVCATVKAQPTVCPVNAGADVTTSCGSPCTSLSATYFQTKATNTYTVSSIPYTPSSYTTGTTVNTPVDDQWYGIINIPFPFCFFGTAYTQCVAGSNGIITFNTGNANTYCPWSFTATIPNSGLPTNSIMTPYHDIDPSVGSSSEIRYAVSGTSPCRKFTISYYRVPLYSCNSNLATHQVVLYETTNIIEIFIQTKPGCISWNGGRAIVGIQNNAGSVGFAAPGRNGGNWTASNEGWRFLPNGAPTSTFNWLANGASIGTTATINVCPSVTTTYTAEAVYTNCNGTTAAVNDQVMVTVPNSSGSGLTVTPSSSSICPGGNTSLTASGANNITWSPAAGLNTTTGPSVIASPSSNTVYTATGTLPNGCTATATASITVGGNAVVTLNFPPGICSGTIAPLSAAGASTYNWFPATGLSGTTGSNVNANPTATTTYTVTGIDAAGCQGTASATLNVWNNPTLTTSFTNITCQGFSDGTATATPANGQSPYTYSWSSSPSQSTAIASNLGPGTYTVTVSDFNNCTVNGTVTISQPTALIVNATSTNVLCNGGSEGTGTGVVSGGTTPYSTSWNTTPIQNGLNASNLPSGNYTFSVQDANGCVGSSNITVSEPSVITFSHTETNPLCFGDANGSIIFSNTLGGNSFFQYSIDGGNSYQSSSSFSGLVAGSYSLLVKDGNGCLGNIVVVNLNDPNQLSVAEIHTNISCSGGTDGAIDISPTGGTLPYSFSWSNGQTSEDISGLGIGIFSVSIIDANNCSIQTSATLIEPPPLVLTEIHQDILCFGESTGFINLSVLGGSTPYSYSWSSGPISEDLNSIPAGSYTQTLTDANGCIGTLNVILTEPGAALNATETHADETCFGNCDASVDVTTTGGTLPYLFSWTGGQNTEDISNICVGNITLQITDNNGCLFSLPVSINGPAAGLNATSVPVYVNCFGDATGSIDITTSGGTIPYSFSWNTGALTEDISGLVAGTYDLLITDQNSCTFPLSVIISEPPPLVLSETHVDIACFGQSTGSINLSVIGGTTPYSYFWSSGPISEDLNSIPAGSYTQTLTDANGCIGSLNVILTEPGAALNATETHADETCFGNCDASVDVTTTGGTLPYLFSWTGGQNTEDISNICVGNITLQITDNNGCLFSLPVSINGPAAGLNATSVPFYVNCFGDATGSIDITTSGGTIPYSFSWNTGALTEDISGLVAGTYDLLITDQNSCTFPLSVIIYEPPPLVLSETHVDIACFGQSTGSIDLTASGGASPYTYNWNSGQSTEDISGLPVGVYTQNLTDNFGCTATLAVTLLEPLAPLSAIETNTAVTCFGYCDGTIDVTPTGGTTPYSFSWSTGESTEDVTNACVGNPILDITDNNGCTFNLPITITGPASGVSASESHINATCNSNNDGSIEVTTTGGTSPYTFIWSNNLTTEDIGNLVAGQYDLMITDQNSCVFNLSVVIGEPLPLLLSETHQDVLCFGQSTGAIDLSISGGTLPYTILWSDGSVTEDLSNLPMGNYTVNVSDNQNCASSISITVAQPLAALNVTETHVDATCFGFCDGTADIFVTGGTSPYSFNWTNGQIIEDPSGLCAGGVGVIVTDANYCPFTLLVSISEPALPISIAGTTTDITCNGGSDGSIDITVSGGAGGYSYTWTNGAGIAEDPTNLSAGNYTVTVTDQTGVCTLDQSYDLFEPSVVSVAASSDQTICLSNTATLSATASGGVGPYTYGWTANPSDPTLVNGANQQNPSVTPTSNTTYTVIATDALGCTSPSSDDMIVSLMQPLTLNLSITGQDSICINESSSFGFTATGGDGNYTYTLDNSSIVQSPQNVSPTSTTTYSIEVTDGCGTPSATETVTFTVNPLPEIQLVSNITEGCEDLRVNFTSNISNCQGAVWEWNFGDGVIGSAMTTFDENATYTYEDPDTFSITLTVTSTDNCVNTANFQDYIIVRPKPIAGFTGKPQITSIMAPNIEFEDQSLGANQWYYEFVDDATFSNDTNPVHTYSDTGIFIVQQIVTTEFGCTDMAFDTIEIRPVYSMYIPNAFTPNDNGINEFYSLVGEGYVEGSFEMTIFTRWGEEVFRTKSLNNPWDGKDRFGKDCPLGVYIFLAKVRSGEDKKVKNYSGKLTLVR